MGGNMLCVTTTEHHSTVRIFVLMLIMGGVWLIVWSGGMLLIVRVVGVLLSVLWRMLLSVRGGVKSPSILIVTPALELIVL